jgi:hypothetical protein
MLFPAAHSMDTTWFAIDADGCVGIFSSGEGGAVPEDLTEVHGNEIEVEGDLLEILAKDNALLIDRDTIDIDFILHNLSLDNLLAEIQATEEINKGRSDNEMFSIYGLFLVVSTAKVVSEIRQQGMCIELDRADDRTIIYTEVCESAWLKKAIESGFVLAGSKEIELEYNLNLLGWHSYTCNQQYPDVYESNKYPKQPILFNDLPPEISKHIKLTKFPNLRFAETKSIQPIEHMLCRTWGGVREWQGTDGEWHEGFPDYPEPTAEDLI